MAHKKNQNDHAALIAKVSFALASSLGIPLAEKKKLLQRLPGLSSAQLEKLIELFSEEENRNQDLLHRFFQKHPDLFSHYDRLSKHHVNAVFQEVEKKERKKELERMKEIAGEV